MDESTEPSEIRVGDTEREAAMTALGEHMSAGRLDVDEYGERSAKVAAARTRGELLEVFTDLPDPRPVFGTGQPLRQAPRYGGPLPADPDHPKPGEQWGWTTELAQQWDERPVGQRLAAGLVPLSVVIALVLFFSGLVHVWWIFMLIPAAGIISGAILGDQKHAIHAEQRARRDAVRGAQRQTRDHIREAQRQTRHQMRNVRHQYRHGGRRDLDR